MRVHHVSAGTMCPMGGRYIYGVTSDSPNAKLVCHCLIIETDKGLVLVDTGLGTRDVEHPVSRLSPLFLALMRIPLRREETLVHQLGAMGFSPRDVRHIVLTHLDFDHAGGLEDFPGATVHVHATELDAAMHPKLPVSRGRYRHRQWGENIRWKTYHATQGESWFGFDCVRALDGLPPEILMIPLFGHTWGHCGVAVQTGKDWLLHAGDAYFFRDEMNVAKPACTPGLRAYQKLMEVDRWSRLHNQKRLRELKADFGNRVTLFSAHDAIELEQLAAQAPERERLAG